ncbi:MAG: Unknown protein [uncultured Aureispira sp.]|uniref:DNA-binding protein n=1 Tax=uncultured Aureispira sp. TaxID=1331704 RepID=A0A6S6UM73_9BACT|nr:MAG: Unknown protein [uncultured Aureispira sp.]
MGFDNKDSRFESVYSQKVKAGKRRTYFFDVRKTKGADYYVTITESTRRFEDDSYSRHKIFLYKEDFNRFVESLVDVVDHIKTDLLPDYDYDEFTRRHEEREKEYEENNNYNNTKDTKTETIDASEESKESEVVDDEDDDGEVGEW